MEKGKTKVIYLNQSIIDFLEKNKGDRSVSYLVRKILNQYIQQQQQTSKSNHEQHHSQSK